MQIDTTVVDTIENVVDHNTRILNAAIAYANWGMYVIPLRPNSKILPPASTGMNYHSATKNPATVARWFGPGGPYEGYNIGIACGKAGGVFAIDIDDNDSLLQLEEEYGVLDAPIQETPRGGKHYLFQWEENATSSTGKLAKGIDTRGGSADAPRSHIVAWPSVVEGKEYKWMQGGPIPPVPKWVMDKMGVAWDSTQATKGKIGGRGNEQMTPGDVETQYTVAELEFMLKFINPDDQSYEDWLAIGQALHTQHPDEKGLQLWDNWSRQGERYQEDECTKRWGKFNSQGPTRVGSLIRAAMTGGFTFNAMRTEVAELKDIIDEFNNFAAVAYIGSKLRIAYMHPLEPGKFRLLSKEDFQTATQHQSVIVPAASGKMVERRKSDIWLASERRREVLGVGFWPNQGPWYKHHINLWHGWGLEPKKGDWAPIRDHLLHIVCDNNQERFEYLLDWYADILQDPAKPKGTAWIMQGREGTGKGAAVAPMERILGDYFIQVTDKDHLIGRFNSHLMNKTMIFADEAMFGGHRGAAGKIKGIVTERMLTIEIKGMDAMTVPNMSRLIAASNDSWVIPAGADSRRYNVVRVADNAMRDKAYFDKLWACINGEGSAALMHHLLEREIKSNLNHSMWSEELETQRDISQISHDPINEWLEESALKGKFVGLAGYDGWPQVVPLADFNIAYKNWANAKNVKYYHGHMRFAATLKERGFQISRPESRRGIRQRLVYTLTPEQILGEEPSDQG